MSERLFRRALVAVALTGLVNGRWSVIRRANFERRLTWWVSMHMNIGVTDRVLRIVIGVLLSISGIGWVRVIQILTAVFGTCPIYGLCGISSCATKIPAVPRNELPRSFAMNARWDNRSWRRKAGQRRRWETAAFIWIVVYYINVCAAWAQDGESAAEVYKGHHLATMLCHQCHIAATDQSYFPTLSPPAPSFESIARREDVSASSLQKFIATTHQGLDNPNGMPNPSLADFQIKQIVAYILSLRK